ncbi:MAG: HU family DNA-binding protein [Janthinobacterium lividum]
MNKTELVEKVASLSNLGKAEAQRAMDCVFEAICEALVAQDEVRINGFGTFSVADRAATTGRNPRTGEEIQIAATRRPKFKAGKPLIDAVAGKAKASASSAPKAAKKAS